jgi:phenylpropionate dioxygenase-like ring-hydroxylating dioxygenase large terminal subunit
MALRGDQQETLVRVGPGTPMGELMRRYWIPIALGTELPEPDCPQIRVRVLGEDLLAFRDTSGAVGLIDEFCAHRGVSLFFGRNEECGVRCPYHGWKYDVTGQCVDMPSEPAASNFASRVKLLAYPTCERGGLIWAYLGPPAVQPPPPNYDWLNVPPSHIFWTKREQESNWLQALEGAIDSSHVGVLHRYELDHDRLHLNADGPKYIKADTRPVFHTADTPFGVAVGARRNGDTPERWYWRMTPFILPFHQMVPPYGANPTGGHSFVPIDDTHVFSYSFYWHPTTPIDDELRASMEHGSGIHSVNIPGTFRPVANKSNDYLIDRRAQKERKTFSGVLGIAQQDAAVQESMGPIQDRTRERLGTSDVGIIAARDRLLRAAVALRDHGEAPPAVEPGDQHARSASVLLERAIPFTDAVRDAMTPQAGATLLSV